MRLHKPYLLIALLFIPSAVLAGRIAVRAAGAETGPEVVMQRLRALAVGWLIGDEQPIQDRSQTAIRQRPHPRGRGIAS